MPVTRPTTCNHAVISLRVLGDEIPALGVREQSTLVREQQPHDPGLATPDFFLQ